MSSIAKDSEAKSKNKKHRKVNRKWLFIPLLLAVFLLLFIPIQVQGESAPAPSPTAVSTVDTKLNSVYNMTVTAQSNTEKWNHKLHTHDRYGHTKLPFIRNMARATARLAAWRAKEQAARARYVVAVQQFEANQDFHKALRMASARYGVSYNWLHSCASSEGHIEGYRYSGRTPLKSLGIDPFVMNAGNSGAGGWMQFMSGTFYNPKYAVARQELPAKYRVWNSRLGQAWVAAYIFKIEGSKQWTGKGC